MSFKLEKEMTMKSQDLDQMKDVMRAPWITSVVAIKWEFR